MEKTELAQRLYKAAHLYRDIYIALRADICVAYDKWLSDTCAALGIKVIESRPWDTAVNRVVEILL